MLATRTAAGMTVEVVSVSVMTKQEPEVVKASQLEWFVTAADGESPVLCAQRRYEGEDLLVIEGDAEELRTVLAQAMRVIGERIPMEPSAGQARSTPRRFATP